MYSNTCGEYSYLITPVYSNTCREYFYLIYKKDVLTLCYQVLLTILSKPSTIYFDKCSTLLML